MEKVEMEKRDKEETEREGERGAKCGENKGQQRRKTKEGSKEMYKNNENVYINNRQSKKKKENKKKKKDEPLREVGAAQTNKAAPRCIKTSRRRLFSTRFSSRSLSSAP